MREAMHYGMLDLAIVSIEACRRGDTFTHYSRVSLSPVFAGTAQRPTCTLGDVPADRKKMIRSVRPQTLLGEVAVFDELALLHHQRPFISRYLMSPNKWITLGVILCGAALCVLVALLVREFA